MSRLGICFNLLAVVAVPLWSDSQLPSDGADTPQAVVAGMQQAARTNDWGVAMALMLPSARAEIATEVVQAVLLVTAVASPDIPGAARGSVSPVELAGRVKAHAAATDALTAAWTRHGMAALVGLKPLATTTRAAIAAAVAKADVPAMMRDTMPVLRELTTALDLDPTTVPQVPPLGDITGYRIAGDRATATEGRATVDFARVNRRWYLAPPPTP